MLTQRTVWLATFSYPIILRPDDLLVKLAFVSHFLRFGGWSLLLIKFVVLKIALILGSFIKIDMLFFISVNISGFLGL